MLNQYRSAPFIVMVLSLVAAGSYAQDLMELSLDELMDVKIVVAASKYEQKVTEAPSSVTIITAEDISVYGYETLADALSSVRGFNVTYDRNYDYIGVRGFGRPGDYDTRILFLVDGHRLNENIFDSNMTGTGFAVPMELIERIEVIRGPSSSIYGSNAFFGVVNVVTKQSADVEGLTVSGEGGSYSTALGQFRYGNVLPSGVKLTAAGSLYETEGQTLFYDEFASPKDNDGFAEAADYENTGRFHGSLTYEDLFVQAAYVRREKGIPTAAWDTIFNDSQTRGTDERGYLTVTKHHTLAGETDVRGRLSYDWANYYGDYAYDYGDEDEPYRVVNHDQAQGAWWGAELLLSREIGTDHKLLAGTDARYNQRQDQTNFDDEVYFEDKRSSMNWSLHVQDEWRVRDGLTLNVGVRHDRYPTFGGTTNPRVAVILDPIANTTFKLLYGSAFRAPNAYELYYHDGGATQKANPDLQPETIDTYEFVVERYFANRWSATASFYNYRIDDLSSLDLDPEDDLLMFRNLDRVDARGVELEIGGKWFGSLTGTFAYAFQESELRDTRETLPNSPKHIGRLNLRSPLASDRLTGGVELQYTSNRKTVFDDVSKSFVLTNATLTGRFWQDRIELSTSVYNVLDVSYTDPVSEEHVQDLIEQDGRRFRLKLDYRVF